MEESEKVTPEDAPAAEATAEAAPAPDDGTGGEAAALQKELEASQAKAAEYLDGWQRARAEFANYKRRVERDQSEAHQIVTGRVIARFLDVLDDFERALTDPPTESEAATWAKGVSLILRKLQAVLEAEGVERIPADGQPFDPNWHEAVLHEDSDQHEPGQITGVLRPGYRIGERVIRPAQVKVAK